MGLTHVNFDTCRPLLTIMAAPQINGIVNGLKKAGFEDVRTASPGPLAGDFARQQVAKQQRNNFHSSSLASMNVNQTSLHPHGVTYVSFQKINVFNLITKAGLTLSKADAEPHGARGGAA